MQPDFRPLFREYFDAQRDPLSYKLRDDGNLRHDAVFLSSLLHDAVFPYRDIVEESDRLAITLERDRWERPRGPIGEVDSVISVLSFRPVARMRWCSNLPTMPETQFQIYGFFVVHVPPVGRVQCILLNERWRLKLCLHQDFEVRLSDR